MSIEFSVRKENCEARQGEIEEVKFTGILTVKSDKYSETTVHHKHKFITNSSGKFVWNKSGRTRIDENRTTKIDLIAIKEAHKYMEEHYGNVTEFPMN